jgi:hypothetical protein
MAAHTLRLIIIMATFCALGVPGFAFAKSCEDEAGTVDERFEKLKANGLSDKENSVAHTKLLNEAYTPFLKEFESRVYRIPIQKMKELAKELVEFNHDHEVVRERRLRPLENDFNASFKAMLMNSATGDGYLIAPYTEFNRKAMTKLFAAVTVLSRLTDAGDLTLPESTTAGAQNLLEERTYAETDFETQMHLSYHALMQSVAALTADPVTNWLPEAMLKNVMKPQGACPSLVVMHSVMLPPRLLGENGNRFYREHAVEDVGNRLMVTADFRSFIKFQKDEFAKKEGHKYYEFMHGCPVGHTQKDDLYSGLQSFTNAVLWVYEAIEWDI